MAAKNSNITKTGPRFNTPGHYGALEVVDIDPDNFTARFQVRFADGTLGGSPTSVPVSMIYPDSPEDTHQFWELFLRKLIDEIRTEGKIPTEYKDFQLTTDRDSTGDPALYVKILIEPGKLPSDIKVTEWNRFTNLIRDRLIDIFRIQRWPYVQLTEAENSEHVPSR